MKIRTCAGLAAGFVAAVLAAPVAQASPVTVQLRIEGPTHTLFEGPVTTDVRTFHFTGDPVQHKCDGTTTGGTSPTPVPTRAAVVTQASEVTPFSTQGTWSDQFGVSFTKIAGESVAFDPATNKFLAEYKNAAFANLGACADPVAQGDDVLFAYGDGSEELLALSGPSRAAPNASVAVRVTNAATHAPVAGAIVGGKRTAANGTALVGPLTKRGVNTLKASKPGAIRSNAVKVCITNGADGSCGTVAPPPPDTVAPIATIDGIRNGQRFSRRHAPRELHGTASDDRSGLWAVKIRLTRKFRKTCWYFSGTKERFLKRTCGKKHAFKVGDQTTWSYLLPSRLKRGRYVLDTYAIDKAFNRGAEQRVRFRVR